MKFLNVYCEERKEELFINLDKIIAITKLADKEECRIELEGNLKPIIAAMAAEDLIRKINGEDRTGIGFRRSV